MSSVINRLLNRIIRVQGITVILQSRTKKEFKSKNTKLEKRKQKQKNDNDNKQKINRNSNL